MYIKLQSEEPEGKRILYRPSDRLKDNIKMYLKGTVCEGLIKLAQGRIQYRAVVNTVMNLWVIKGEVLLGQLSDYEFM
jgi:hypothetical protein